MSTVVALSEYRTVDVTPLGVRGRYSLTPHLQAAYLAIVAHVDAHGQSQTYRELADHFGNKSASNARQWAIDLEARGWITIARNAEGRALERGLTPTEPVLRNLVPVPPLYSRR